MSYPLCTDFSELGNASRTTANNIEINRHIISVYFGILVRRVRYLIEKITLIRVTHLKAKADAVLLWLWCYYCSATLLLELLRATLEFKSELSFA